MARASRRLACCLPFFFGAATAQFYRFCTDGISKPDFVDGAAVEVILAQAPLFSTNPKIGQKAGYLNMYHAAIVFAQGSGEHRRYWTLEFDSTQASVLNNIVPSFIENSSAPGGTSLAWDNDIRYCITRGLLWGRKHWTKTFDVVFTLTVDQAMSAWENAVVPVNTTARGTKPQYQLWRVVKTGSFGGARDVLVQDITCNQGARWFLHYVASALDSEPPPHFVFQGTAVDVEVDRIEKVNTDDPKQWSSVVMYFRTLHSLLNQSTSVLHKFVDLFELSVERKYVYDTNAQVYYELITRFEPWISLRLEDLPLAGPDPLGPRVEMAPEPAESLVV